MKNQNNQNGDDLKLIFLLYYRRNDCFQSEEERGVSANLNTMCLCVSALFTLIFLQSRCAALTDTCVPFFDANVHLVDIME